MKKIFTILLLAVAATTVTSCYYTKEEAGGTSIEKMCGFWDVLYYAVDEQGIDVFGFPIADGVIYTYNTSDNTFDEMWIDDQETFWAYKFKVSVNYPERSFGTENSWVPYDAEETGNALIFDGKIEENGALSEHDLPIDKISFSVKFDDDEDAEDYGYDHFLVVGSRHTGY